MLESSKIGVSREIAKSKTYKTEKLKMDIKMDCMLEVTQISGQPSFILIDFFSVPSFLDLIPRKYHEKISQRKYTEKSHVPSIRSNMQY